VERRFRRVTWVATLAVVLSGCGGTAPGDADPAQRDAVAAVVRAYYEAFNSRDWDALAVQFWDDAQILTVWQRPGEVGDRMVATSVKQFVAEAPRHAADRSDFEMRMLEADIRIFGNLAVAWVPYGASLTRDTGQAEWQGADAFTLLRHEGDWKIAALAFASVDS